jgi:uncharacterized membrane protein
MNIDFTETARLLERSDLFQNLILLALVAILLIWVVGLVLRKQFEKSKAFRAVLYSVAVVLVASSFVSMFVSMRSDRKAISANIAAVQEASNETYGLELSYENAKDLVNYYGGSGKFFSPVLANEEISNDLLVFGSTKVEDTNGEIIDVALVARDGDYELVGGEGRYVELPKVG